MTQLPSPKKSSNNSSNYENSDAELKIPPQQEGQSSDWHQRMANLVGLEEEIPPPKEESSASETTSSSNASSNDEVPPSHPSSLRTQQRFSSNPFAKVAVVGAATLSGVLIAGIFLSQLMSGNNKQPRKISPTITQNTNELNKTEQLKPEQEIEILKTKLALAEQAKAVKAAQLQLRTVRPPTRATPTPTQTRSQPQPVTRVVVQRVPTPARTVYVPRVVERIVRVPQRVAQVKPTPTQSPQPPRATPTPTPQPTVTATPSATFELTSVPELAPIPMPSDVGEALSTNRSITPTPTVPQVASSPPAPLASEFNSRARQPLPNRTNTTTNPQEQSLASNQTKQYGGKAIAIGTKAKAVLAADITGEANRPGSNNSSSSNNNNNKDDSQFVVRLKEPLKSVDGAIALPKNTELVAQIKQITEGGWVQLSVVSVNFQNNGNITEIRLPPDAIKIRRPGGRPLLARKYPDKSGKIAGNDTFSGLLGGLGQVGDILNRPETRTEVYCTRSRRVNNPNNNSNNDENEYEFCAPTSRTEQQRNIPAAILEGASKVIVPQVNQRNQQATQEMMKSNIWHLEAGTEVEVYANKITRL
ncbi:hypothetical protein SAMD00079811_01700 [Scytonema sp. HK-05]|uniref:hypothetical protein n=1 Tax=Scytonema sp. HK-05 TaxID=1137095 RepID=UPI0009368E41|nr:hypothetical protein [Scytonema sp. HK-05]OKH59928.1 hypothetical protein NIES2130_05540 [Scytonema sp. HK-05]BAY42592.1 hypothetical protein SAMD00079811_01700 [Scytonema sp. HK-05]